MTGFTPTTSSTADALDALEAFGLSATRHRYGRPGERRHLREPACRALDVVEVARRARAELRAIRDERVLDQIQPIAVGIGERPQEDAVDIAVLAPIPSASVRTAMNVTPGVRASNRTL